MEQAKDKITIQGVDVEIKHRNENDYISLTDMLKAKDGEFFITDWLRNRNTLEYIGIWETLHNPNFNYGEFAVVRNKAGLHSFKIGVKQFVEKTNAISLFAMEGRYGGTYAHKDIAFEFALWISAEFKVYFIAEFQRLKELEQAKLNWSAKRELAKVNYHLQTNAIAQHIFIPTLTEKQKTFVYCDEADLLNVIVFGKTAKEWREQNPNKNHAKENMRDFATLHQLNVLSYLENYNARLIARKVSQAERMTELSAMAQQQMSVLAEVDSRMLLQKKGNT